MASTILSASSFNGYNVPVSESRKVLPSQSIWLRSPKRNGEFTAIASPHQSYSIGPFQIWQLVFCQLPPDTGSTESNLCRI